MEIAELYVCEKCSHIEIEWYGVCPKCSSIMKCVEFVPRDVVLRVDAVTIELESLLLAVQYHMDTDREFAGKCLEKSLMIIKNALASADIRPERF